MVIVFRLVYLGAALLAGAAGALVIASRFIADRAPQGTEFLGIHLAVGAVLQRHVAGIAALARGRDGEPARELATRVSRLLAYLVAGGALLCVVLGAMTYGIVERIGQGFAVFG